MRSDGTLLAVGLELFLDYAVATGAVNASERSTLLAQWNEVLIELGQEQGTNQTVMNPATRFIELLRSAMVSGLAHVAGALGDYPETPQRWGWRVNTAKQGSSSWEPQGDCIGWVEKGDLYLDPDSSYRVVQRIGPNEITVTPQTLRKRLFDNGLLASTEQETRGTLTIRRSLQGARRNVIHMYIQTVVPSIADQSDQADQGPEIDEANTEVGQVLWSGEGRDEEESRPANPTNKAHYDTANAIDTPSGRVGQFGHAVETASDDGCS